MLRTGAPRRLWPWLIGGAALGLLLATGALAADGELATARRDHTMTLLPDGTVLVVGGTTADGGTASVERIDPGSLVASTAVPLLQARREHTATLLSDGTVLIAGGRGEITPTASTEIYDPVTDTIVAGPPLARARAGHTATALDDGRILVAGGELDQTAELYDPAAGSFTLLAQPMRRYREQHSAIALADGRVLIAGGRHIDGGALDLAEIWVSEELGFVRARGWLHAERVRPELRRLWDGKVLIYGGDERGTLEVFDPRGRYMRALADPTIAASLLTRTESSTVPATPMGTTGSVLQQVDASSVVSQVDVPFVATPSGAASVDVPDHRLRLVTGGGVGGGLSSAIARIERSAQISTDRIDYSDTMSPRVEGRGWLPGESILIFRQTTAAAGATPTVMHATADADGSWVNQQLGPGDHLAMATHLLTAVGGSSGRVAQTVYYDAPNLQRPEGASDEPVRVRARLPLDGSAAQVDTEIGPAEIRDWRLLGDGAADDPALVDLHLDLGDQRVQDLLPMPLCSSSAATCVTIEQLSGGLNLVGDIDLTVQIDWGDLCIPCDLFNPQCWSIGTCEQCCDYYIWQTYPGDCTFLGFPIPCLGCWGDPFRCLGCVYPACCDCELNITLPEVSMGAEVELHAWVDPELFARLNADVELEGTWPVPFLGYAASIGIEDALEAELTIGLVFRVAAGVEGLIVDLYAAPDFYFLVGAGFPAYDRDGDGWDDFIYASVDVPLPGDARLELVELGSGSVGVKIGPEIGLELSALSAISLDLGAGIWAGLEAEFPLDPLFINEECLPWQAGVDFVIDAEVTGELPIASAVLNALGIPTSADWTLWSPDLFDVYGQAAGLEVTTTTLGLDLDPNGYLVSVVRSAPLTSPAWEGEHQMPMGHSSEETLSAFPVCPVFLGMTPNCPLAATEYDVTLDDLAFNCWVAPGSAVHRELCLPFDQVQQLHFNVLCESSFNSLSDTIDDLIDQGEITDPELVDELEKLLADAEKARDQVGGVGLPLGAAAGSGSSAPITSIERIATRARRPSCEMLMARFVTTVRLAADAGQIAPEAALLLVEHASEMAASYCSPGVEVSADSVTRFDREELDTRLLQRRTVVDRGGKRRR